MRKFLAIFFAGSMLWTGAAYAELVTVIDEGSDESSTHDDADVVDLSDKDTDQPTWSPSFENTTPAGQAPGGPIEE